LYQHDYEEIADEIPAIILHSFTRFRWNNLDTNHLSQLRHIGVIDRVLHAVDVLALTIYPRQ
jgi:hypothetical protein